MDRSAVPARLWLLLLVDAAGRDDLLDAHVVTTCSMRRVVTTR
jgi:hypothetical protein